MQTSESIKPDMLSVASPGMHTVRPFIGCQVKEGYILLETERVCIVVGVVKEDTLRLAVAADDRAFPASTVAVLRQETTYNGASSIETDGDITHCTLGAFHLTLHRETGEMDIRHDCRGGIARKLVFHRNAVGRIGLTIGARPTTRFYGLGEMPGNLDKRHDAYTMWNSDVYAPHVPEMESLYVSIPFVTALDGVLATGIFLDNPGRSVFDFRSRFPDFEITADTGGFDLYFFVGPTLKDVTRQYTQLTGRMQIPPRWALGYHQSRYSYASQDEVVALADSFIEKEIPLAAIHLDIHYMNGYRVFTFDENRFQNPKQMVQELREKGIRIVPIVDPGVKRDPDYMVYRDGVENDVFCKSIEGDIFFGEVWPGESAFPDFTDDRVSSWWGSQHDFYVNYGISGIWNDMNEPAVFNEIKTMEPHVMHRNNGQPLTHRELHNLYGLLMSKATFEALREQLKGERPFVLTRAGYAGVQRYGAVWTGDNRSFWSHMEMAMPMVLNMGLSGIAFAGPDVGGFAHHASGELLARWTQMGAFFPFFRNHSALDTARQEPWAFGQNIEEIVRQYITLRYMFMPYLYSLFREAANTGTPVMRPLVFEYPEDEMTQQISDQFLVGKNVLVAPVYRSGETCRKVYLPKGTWVNYWTGERVAGGRNILVDAPMDVLPLFVRAGAILPLARKDERGNSTLTLCLYPDLSVTHSSFVLYEDDGETYAYEQGEYTEREFSLEARASSVHFLCRDLHNGYNAPEQIRLCIFKPDGTVLETDLVDGETRIL